MTARSEVRRPNHCAKCCQHWCNVMELAGSSDEASDSIVNHPVTDTDVQLVAVFQSVVVVVDIVIWC